MPKEQSPQGTKRLEDLFRQYCRSLLSKWRILHLIPALGPFLSGGHVRHAAISVAAHERDWERGLFLHRHADLTKRLDVAAHEGEIAEGKEVCPHAGPGLPAGIIGHPQLNLRAAVQVSC